ncbi:MULTISPECIES: hypothetical protein [Rhodococcus]|uniref:Uncharacterized protein n=1 Tax=Rhodococcus sp. B2 TaxID=1185468 RepID=A0A8A6W562_9NOCA|nr:MULTISPECIES: hypothetical protein [Rhodococcus]MDO2381027.1 hypothetical protein [Rhodococcus ruber]QTK22453.1 hypothetical protein [Rhodococcus sp. B2]MDO1481819.1 hypothetical protein [Rhodococcus ruber]QSE62469.1 hypothetical protein JYA75_28010 [Rhodococcus sp. PSBB066]WKK14735.1 hypothetical protein QYN14_25920 [Rhodococcus ruber]
MTTESLAPQLPARGVGVRDQVAVPPQLVRVPAVNPRPDRRGRPDVGEGAGERREILRVLGAGFDQDATRPEPGIVYRHRGRQPAGGPAGAGDRRSGR